MNTPEIGDIVWVIDSSRIMPPTIRKHFEGRFCKVIRITEEYLQIQEANSLLTAEFLPREVVKIGDKVRVKNLPLFLSRKSHAFEGREGTISSIDNRVITVSMPGSPVSEGGVPFAPSEIEKC